MAGPRRRGREAALQMLYQMDSTGVSAEEAVRLFWAHLTPGDGTQGTEGESFANELVLGIGREGERVDQAIRDVSEHWRIERMARVDRNVLRLATYELLFMADIPRRVTINEAIELAKRFGEAGTPAFVNGVLDRVAERANKD